MAIHKQSLTEALIRQLYELACTPFRLTSFRQQWDSFGWVYEPGFGDEHGFSVQIPGSWPLTVDPLGGEVLGASLPFCYWEEEQGLQRQAFDEEFVAAASLARKVLPSPVRLWTDTDRDAHRAICWGGDHGYLILQQAAFDPQFGTEINFWLTGCPKENFHPTSPLIDWLCARSRRLHGELGFPSLLL